MAGIFISYRRDDSAAMCDRIYGTLVQHFGKDVIFKDIDSIPLGVNFIEYVRSYVARSAVVLVVIGRSWLDIHDARGHRRIDDPNDFVRLEIEEALNRNIPVVPLWVDHATMPRADQLPESIQRLVAQNGWEVHYDPYFTSDIERVAVALERWVPSLRKRLEDRQNWGAEEVSSTSQPIGEHANYLPPPHSVAHGSTPKESLSTPNVAINTRLDTRLYVVLPIIAVGIGLIADYLVNVLGGNSPVFVKSYLFPVTFAVGWLALVFWQINRIREGYKRSQFPLGVTVLVAFAVVVSLFIPYVVSRPGSLFPGSPLAAKQSITATHAPHPSPTLSPPLSCAPGSWSLTSSADVGSGGSDLMGVAALSATDIWAVGTYSISGTTQRTLIEHWGGSSWGVVSSPNVGLGTNALDGVTAISANDVWAVGQRYDPPGISGPVHALIEHWNGSSWSVVTNPSVGIETSLNDVAAVSATDVWATGFFETSSQVDEVLIEHWNGSSWSVVTSPSVASNNAWLDATAAISADNVWAVGYYDVGSGSNTLTEHWNGTAWNIVPDKDPGTVDNHLFGLAAVPETAALWAVGAYDNADRIWHTFIEHWNGTTWSLVSSPDISSSHNILNAVVAVSADDVWAVGKAIVPASNEQSTLIEHWDGVGWSITSTSALTSMSTNLLGVTYVAETGRVWAVGSYDNSSNAAQTATLQCHP